jgi:LacI family transcriptional regulator
MISVREIAHIAHTSIGTVDRVLHGRGRVAATTRARVLAIVHRHGYKPNIYARNLSLGKMFTFGVLMPAATQDGSYWRIPLTGIRRAESELAAYRVRVRVFPFDRYSEKGFWSAAQRCSRADIDGLLLAPVLPSAAGRALRELFARVPTVYFDSTIPGTSPLATVLQDPYQSGVLAATLMCKLLPTGGHIAAVKVLPADSHIEARVRGFLQPFMKQSRYTVEIHEAESKDTQLLARTLPAKIVRHRSAPCGVFVSNAWTHPFARFIAQHCRDRRVHLIGYDLIPENRACLQIGAIDFLISQRPAMQGYHGIMALFRHIVLRERVDRQITVPLDILTRESQGYYRD